MTSELQRPDKLPGAPADLVVSDVPWVDLDVPQGWEPVADLCRAVAARVEDLTERIVRAIEDEIPAYRELPAVPRGDLSGSVRSNLEVILRGIAERRRPRPDELVVRRELGHRRALQGQPVDAIIQAFEIGYRETWVTLVDAAENDPVAKSLLLQAVLTLWTWVQEVSNAVADAHRITTRNRQAVAAALHQRFFELLTSGDLESDELSDLATSLGFDLRGTFQGVVLRPDAIVGDEPHRVESELSLLNGRSRSAARGTDVLVLMQGVDERRATEHLGNVVLNGRIGVGLVRPGLPGARLSIGDAERAMGLSRESHRIASYREQWLVATLNQSQERLRPLLEEGHYIGLKNPQFAETVIAFATSGFSVSETARALNLHPNTAVYRLKRWEELTGWNPRTFEGLSASLIAMSLPWESPTQDS